jgi:hypothetical protein
MRNAIQADKGMLPRVALAFAAATFAVAAAGCGTRPAADQAAAVRVTTDPPDAFVSLDSGASRTAPHTFEGLAAGTHVLTATRDGYADARRSVSLLAGQQATVDIRLTPLLGLVLIHSAPQGADITMNGAYRGRTPLFIPDFPLGSHRLNFSLQGFGDREIELNVRDRTPVRVDVELATQSARLIIDSRPSGAAVTIDGVPRGATPCTLEHLAGQTVRLELALNRHETYVESISLAAGQTYEIAPTLSPLPASLRATSEPQGAKVFVDGDLRGETPLTLSDLRPGPYRLRMEATGFEPDERAIDLRPAEQSIQHAQLARNSGTLVIVTVPPEVDVYVNGELKGKTQPSPSGLASAPLTIDFIPQGDHTLQLSRRGYAYRPRPFRIESDKIIQLHEQLTRLFIPDTIVVRKGGDGQYELTGQIIRRFPNGDLEFEVSKGVIMRIEADSIVELKPIKPSDD